MPTARDRAPRNRRRLLPLTVLIAAAVALLAFAGTAAAETKIGEGTAPVNPAIPAEADIVKATASYDSTGGAVNFTVTTVAEPNPGTEADPSELGLIADLLTTSLPCTESLLSTEAVFPLLGISAPYRADEEPEAGITESLAGGAGEITLEPVTRSVTGVTTALSVTSSLAAGRAFDCAAIAATDEGSPTNWLFFPISVPVVPVTPVVTTTTPPAAAAAPAPAPAPGALSIAKSKPLKLKVGKSRTVKIKVTTTGATATGPGSLRVKAPAGVLVKPERQKLPVLQAGETWTLAVRVQLTPKAKKSSTLSLVGAAGTVTAKSSLVLKLAGG
jgi:hypothetical protein